MSDLIQPLRFWDTEEQAQIDEPKLYDGTLGFDKFWSPVMELAYRDVGMQEFIKKAVEHARGYVAPENKRTSLIVVGILRNASTGECYRFSFDTPKRHVLDSERVKAIDYIKKGLPDELKNKAHATLCVLFNAIESGIGNSEKDYGLPIKTCCGLVSALYSEYDVIIPFYELSDNTVDGSGYQEFVGLRGIRPTPSSMN